LHTFFGLAQFCKKPCNLVFNVLQFFKNKNKTILLFFIANVLGKCLALWAQALKPTSSPGGKGNVAPTTGIPSGTENLLQTQSPEGQKKF
jgi:hypothetical protein